MESLRKLAKHCAVVVCALSFCLPITSEANTFYRVKLIKHDKSYSFRPSSSKELKINNEGKIIGYCFLWSPSKGIQYHNDLYSGTLPGFSGFPYPYNGPFPETNKWCPIDINDSGQIIGRAYNLGIELSFLLSPSGDMRSLGYILPFKPLNTATRINNAGQIIGVSSYNDSENPHAFLLSPGSDIKDLTTLLAPSLYQSNLWDSVVMGINDKGQIIWRVYYERTHFYYSNLLLDPISGVLSNLLDHNHLPMDINNVGQVIGVSPPYENVYSKNVGQAFIWRSLSPSQIEIDYLFPENLRGQPDDINDLGQVVGYFYNTEDLPFIDYSGFIWDKKNGLKKLDNLIDPGDPLKPYLTIEEAEAINDKGQIVAIAKINYPYDGDATSPFPYRCYECFAIVLLTPTTPTTPSSLTIDLLDPVPALLVGSTVSTNSENLAKKGRLVEGVGADGVATLVLRIHASSVGESITLTLNGPSTDEAGALEVLGATPDALSTTVSAEYTTAGPMAFALYRAPVDFAWNESHKTLKRRSVTLTASSATSGSVTKSIDVIRPPVVLIHGLWGDSSAWSEFTPLISDKAFDLYNFNYQATNGEAIATNANKLFNILHNIAAASSDVENAAIAQVDIVAHSMGGLIVRSLPPPKNDNFSRRNFNKGYIHKLITIGTPHLGSPLARDLVRPENACLAGTFTELGFPVEVDGAVGDLKGDGDGNGLSDALKKLQNVPMATLAGRISPTQISNIRMSVFKNILGHACYYSNPAPPLLNKFTPDNYSSLMGGYHDGIVPLTSAINKQNGEAWGDGLKEEGGLHSGSIGILGFLGPSLLQGDSVVSGRVIELLNTPVSGTEFIKP